MKYHLSCSKEALEIESVSRRDERFGIFAPRQLGRSNSKFLTCKPSWLILALSLSARTRLQRKRGFTVAKKVAYRAPCLCLLVQLWKSDHSSAIWIGTRLRTDQGPSSLRRLSCLACRQQPVSDRDLKKAKTQARVVFVHRLVVWIDIPNLRKAQQSAHNNWLTHHNAKWRCDRLPTSTQFSTSRKGGIYIS